MPVCSPAWPAVRLSRLLTNALTAWHSEAARHRGLLASQQRGGVVNINQPFYGNRGSLNDDDRAKRHNRGTPLPDEFQQDLGVEIMSKVPVDIDTVRTIITGATGLDVVLRTTYPTQTGVIEVPVSGTLLVDHRGPLSSLLDRVGSRFDLSWSFDGSSIRFDRMVNVAYDVPLPPTSGTLGAEVTGVRTGTSSISSGKSVKVDPWAEITDALKQVVPPPASVTLSPNTGKITVFGPPSVQQTAGEIIDQFSDVYLKRIGLEIATYFVDADRNGEVGFGAFLQGLFDDYQASSWGNPLNSTVALVAPESLVKSRSSTATSVARPWIFRLWPLKRTSSTIA